MVVDLEPEQQRVIDLAIQSGAFHNTSEVIATALSMRAEDIEDGAVSEARNHEPRFTLDVEVVLRDPPNENQIESSHELLKSVLPKSTRWLESEQSPALLVQAMRGNEVVGCGAATVGDRCAVLMCFAVRIDLRSKGIGEQMVELMIGRLAERGLQSAYLFSPDVRAQTFWHERLKFQKIEFKEIVKEALYHHPVKEFAKTWLANDPWKTTAYKRDLTLVKIS